MALPRPRSDAPLRLARPIATIALGLCGCQLDPHTTWDNPRDPTLAERTGMRVVEEGRFTLGSFGDLGGAAKENAYAVEVSGFLMDTVEVDQTMYTRLVGSLPAGNQADCPKCPVVEVTWFDAVRMCNLRSVAEGFDPVYAWESVALDSGRIIQMDGLTMDASRNGYRLPFEVEWEWAARGGLQDGTWPWGNDSTGFEAFAWARSNTAYRKRAVGLLRPNGWGLHDMSGNVWEWVWDNHAPYDSFQRRDPRGPADAPAKVVRGGSAGDPVSSLACAHRITQFPYGHTWMLGFRCARNLVR